MSAPLDIEGPAAPPRSNGELVFAEPWESRAFGMAVTLYDAGVFTWPDFQAALIAPDHHMGGSGGAGRTVQLLRALAGRTGGCAHERARRLHGRGHHTRPIPGPTPSWPRPLTTPTTTTTRTDHGAPVFSPPFLLRRPSPDCRVGIRHHPPRKR